MISLSEEQKAAAYTDSKRVLCIAGAGSGKSRTLIGRAEYLLTEKQVSPHELCLVTFTRKAASEMRERIEKTIGPDAKNITIGTIHAFALNLLNRFGDYIGMMAGKITVYSEWEEQFLLKDVARELGYFNGKTWKKIKKKDIDKAMFMLYTAGHVDEDAVIPNRIIDAFFARCRENNSLTYGGLLVAFRTLLPAIGQYVHFKHIMIDEIQDNDRLQFAIFEQLAEITCASFFFVGDYSQCIYQFRGAYPKYLTKNIDTFDVFHLSANYRSDANIVTAANLIIKNNENRIDHEMVAMREGVNVPSHFKNCNSQAICEIIQDLVELKTKQIAVLARNHFMLKKLSRLLSENDIKHDYVGKKSAIVKTEMFRRIHAFMKLVINEHDDFSFLLIRDIIGMSFNEYRDVRLKAVKSDQSHFMAWFLDQYGEGEWREMFSFLLNESGTVASFLDAINKVHPKYIDFDNEPTFDFITDWLADNQDGTIEQYMTWLATYEIQDELKKESDSPVQLMTVHCSKGLEFETVIVAGLNEGILPSGRSDTCDERNVAYVAATRAEDTLILTSRPTVDGYGKEYPVSRFVGEFLG